MEEQRERAPLLGDGDRAPLGLPHAHFARAALICILLVVGGAGILTSAGGGPRSVARTKGSSGGISFAVLGDWGRDGHFKQRKVAAGMEDVFAKHAVDFIVSSGDNFYDEGVESVADARFNSSFEDIYTGAKTRELPWYVILGNHDHLGSIDAQIKYGDVSKRWNMPARYYTRDTGDGVLFIFLDTTPYVRDNYGRAARAHSQKVTEQQVAWLEDVMHGADPASYFVVFGHHNMYTMSIAGNLGCMEIRARIEPILLRYRSRVLAYISGHEHSLMHMQPYGDKGEWTGTAKHIRAVRTMRRFKRPSKTLDHFLSGAGSKLDPFVTPDIKKAAIWSSCCGVLRKYDNHDKGEPRALWGAETHGFFIFNFDDYVFEATAYNHTGNQIYSYRRAVE